MLRLTNIYFNIAGLICFELNKKVGVHFLVRPSHWKWGYSVEEYDSYLQYWGAGPLFLVVYCP